MSFPRNTIRWAPKVIAQPAAGAEFSISPDTASTWLIRSIVARLTTSAAVANRMPVLTQDNGGLVYARFLPASVQAAGAVVDYSAVMNGTPQTAVGGFAEWNFPPDGVWLPQGHRLRSATQLIDVADQWSAIAIFYLEFPTGPGEYYWPGPMTITSPEGY